MKDSFVEISQRNVDELRTEYVNLADLVQKRGEELKVVIAELESLQAVEEETKKRIASIEKDSTARLALAQYDLEAARGLLIEDQNTLKAERLVLAADVGEYNSASIELTRQRQMLADEWKALEADKQKLILLEQSLKGQALLLDQRESVLSLDLHALSEDTKSLAEGYKASAEKEASIQAENRSLLEARADLDRQRKVLELDREMLSARREDIKTESDSLDAFKTSMAAITADFEARKALLDDQEAENALNKKNLEDFEHELKLKEGRNISWEKDLVLRDGNK